MSRDVLSRPAPPPDHRIAYGKLPQQFGHLRIPPLAADKRAPLLVFFHGGWWMNEFDLTYAGHLCEALKQVGVATWSVEYRRIGDPGGAWPGTLQDAAAGFDFAAELAKDFPLNVSRVVCAGHSAGGHLAYWLAGRRHIPEASVLHAPAPALPMHAAVALAGAVDLELILQLGGLVEFSEGPVAVRELMGGTPQQYPERYRAADPGMLLPFNVPQTLVQGTGDTQIPPQLPQRWADKARRQGDHVQLEILEGADHFDIVDPKSAVWPRVQASLLAAFSA